MILSGPSGTALGTFIMVLLTYYSLMDKHVRLNFEKITLKKIISITNVCII